MEYVRLYPFTDYVGGTREDGGLVVHNVLYRECREGDEGEEGVEKHDSCPHVSERLGEDSGRLLLDELGGCFEAGDAEHGRREAVEDGSPHGAGYERLVFLHVMV